jgi:hypothetical protein
VVFGCGTTLDDEAAVKIAGFVRHDGGFGHAQGLSTARIDGHLSPPARGRHAAVHRHAGVGVPRAFLRCLRQQRRWPWGEFDRFLSEPLAEIREEFGITAVHREVGAGGT